MPVVVEAIYLHDYKIKITFDNGEEKIADCAKWLKGKVFEPPKTKAISSVFLWMAGQYPGPMEPISRRRLCMKKVSPPGAIHGSFNKGRIAD